MQELGEEYCSKMARRFGYITGISSPILKISRIEKHNRSLHRAGLETVAA